MPSILFDDELLNNLSYVIEQEKLRYVSVRVHPYIAAYITKGLLSLHLKWAWKLRCRIKIMPDSSLSLFESKFFNKDGEEIIR